MTFSRLCLCAVVWMSLTIHVIQATPLENDISTKLAELTEQMTKLSGQLSKVSEQQQEHADHLSKLTEKQGEQSGYLSRLSEEQTQHSEQQLRQVAQLSKLSEQQSQTSGQVDKLTNQVTEVTAQQTYSGPVFVRWGRKTCNGTGSEIVYTGLAGGSRDTDTGGGADLLCMPKNPDHVTGNNFDDAGGDIYVAEYKLPVDPIPNYPFENDYPLLLDTNVPCAVCQVSGSSVMMIPARVDCYCGWRLEYRGFLMSASSEKSRLQHVCVDEHPVANHIGGEITGFSVGLYPVETYIFCDSEPCPSYNPASETACVVCSK